MIDGKGWRSGALVEQKRLSQWFLKITDYSEDLLSALKELERWPDRVRLMQENWIGRSEGMRLNFEIEGRNERLEVFRPERIRSLAQRFVRFRPTTPLPVNCVPKIQT